MWDTLSAVLVVVVDEVDSWPCACPMPGRPAVKCRMVGR